MPNITAGNVISSTAQIKDEIITSADIKNDEVKNEDIKSDAAIDVTKLSGAARSGANSDITSLSGLTTPLTVAQGGTGKASITTGKILVGNGTGVPTEADAGVTSGKAGSTSRNLGTASGNQTIAHGLGRTPVLVEITLIEASTTGSTNSFSFGTYDGTTNACVFRGQNSNAQHFRGNETTFAGRIFDSGATDSTGQTITVTVDSTNITLAWIKSGSPSRDAYISWRVI